MVTHCKMHDVVVGDVYQYLFIILTWNTVNIARMMLSNEVIPLFGPSHFSKQTDRLALININNLHNERDCRQYYYIA